MGLCRRMTLIAFRIFVSMTDTALRSLVCTNSSPTEKPPLRLRRVAFATFLRLLFPLFRSIRRMGPASSPSSMALSSSPIAEFSFVSSAMLLFRMRILVSQSLPFPSYAFPVASALVCFLDLLNLIFHR